MQTFAILHRTAAFLFTGVTQLNLRGPEIVECGECWYLSCITAELQAACCRVPCGAQTDRIFRDFLLAERSVPSDKEYDYSPPPDALSSAINNLQT